jgi:hypothetical protein
MVSAHYLAVTLADPFVLLSENRGKTKRFTAFMCSALDQHLILREVQTHDVVGEGCPPLQSPLPGKQPGKLTTF